MPLNFGLLPQILLLFLVFKQLLVIKFECLAMLLTLLKNVPFQFSVRVKLLEAVRTENYLFSDTVGVLIVLLELFGVWEI